MKITWAAKQPHLDLHAATPEVVIANTFIFAWQTARRFRPECVLRCLFFIVRPWNLWRQVKRRPAGRDQSPMSKQHEDTRHPVRPDEHQRSSPERRSPRRHTGHRLADEMLFSGRLAQSQIARVTLQPAFGILQTGHKIALLQSIVITPTPASSTPSPGIAQTFIPFPAR